MADTPHLVITVHGIRTYGNWQDELKKLLEAAEPGVTVQMYRYGFFSSLAFLIPPFRWVVGQRFRRFFENEVRSAPEGARIDLVAHSFGTYLAASALRHLPARRKIHTVIFAGSVLPPSFPWYRYLQSGAVGRVVNECGWDDSVLVLCQSTALLMGMAGRIGFHGMVGDRFTNRYYRWGHGGYFDGHQRFMREEWIPLLTRDIPVPAHDERPALTAFGGLKLFLLNNMHIIKVAGAFLLLMLAILIPLQWRRDADYRKKAERINHIARLTNAQEIPGRDPALVRALLNIDAQASGHENGIDHLIGNENADDSRDNDSDDDGREPRWWESLLGMASGSPQARLARFYHHKANQQLVASNKKSGDANMAEAKAYYQRALDSYRKINDDDPALGSYALCLIDYGKVLAGMADHTTAIDQFKMVRDGVFPRSADGRTSNRPASLVVDSLIAESSSHKALGNWTNAADCLQAAIAQAKPDKALLSNAYNQLAWLQMDQLQINDAVKNFLAAEEACRDAVRDQVAYTIRLYHIRHGLALANRLKGNSAEAYAQYRQIVKELQELMTTDLTFTPKQRRDLRDRLFNSMERRADVKFFARREVLSLSSNAELARLASLSPPVSAADSDDSTSIEDEYQASIDLLGNDNLAWKTCVAYKAIIARLVADLENGDLLAVAEPRDRKHVRDSIDLEFAEANRTIKTLPKGSQDDLEIYRAIAEACMGLRSSVTPASPAGVVEPAVDFQPAVASTPVPIFAPRAVEKLRALTQKYAPIHDKLNREKLEMLLLAHEILVKMGIEPDAAKRTQDATRMMSVLGVSTDVASHPELAPYFERFQRIALEQISAGPSSAAETVSQHQNHVAMKPIPGSPEIVRFWLQLGPWLNVKLTTQRLEPHAAQPPTDRAPRQVEALSSKRP
jgi:tetratricopeptide (TPR) repeat protein